MKIYFDNAASTKMKKEVIEFLIDNLNTTYANPSATHFLGSNSRVLLEKARADIANLFNIKAQDIVFTSGATESNNLLIKGILEKTSKKTIISSNIEHSSITNVLDDLKEKGYNILKINTKKDGLIDLDHLNELLKNDDIALVTVMYVNNETGCIQPIEKISEILKDKDIHFHVDAVQMIGKQKFYPYDLNIDSMSASAHKFYGPKGVGFLYIKDDILIKKQILGGPQERNKRAGTENLNNILAMNFALNFAYENMEKDYKYISELNTYFLEKLKKFENVKINGENRIPHIINLQIKDKELNFLLPFFDLNGICLSGGSACMSGSVSGSNVLKNMGLSEKEALSSIRISFSTYNTKQEIDTFFSCLEKL